MATQKIIILSYFFGFRNFHEARLKRKKYEIKSGLIYPDETDLDMLLEGCD